MIPEAIILDRDGTVLDGVEYKIEEEQIRLIPGVVSAFRVLNEHNIRLFVATNQSIVARGIITWEKACRLNDLTLRLMLERGVKVEGWAMCPHHPAGTVAEYAHVCPCRKPKDGLLRELAARYRFSLARTVMVGDNVTDLEAGHQAGCLDAWLVCTGHGQSFRCDVPEGKVFSDMGTLADHVARLRG